MIKNDNLEQATSLIVSRATQLVNQLVNNRGHENPPFSPEEFAHLKGIKEIVKTDLGTVSAILLKFHDGDVIKVNSNHYPVRQNFSGAHEIGHILFNELQLEQCMTNIEYRTHNSPAFMGSRPDAVERLCDVAATELLMPRDIYKKHLLNFGISINSVRQLADLFRVSVHTAAIRVAEVSPEPCIALLWRKQGNKSKALNLVWPKSKLMGKSFYTLLHKRVMPPSALHKAYDYDHPVKCFKKFKVNNQHEMLALESKGFGYGEFRYVLSLAYPDRKKNI